MSSHDTLAEILEVGLQAGALLLRHGAETWRIEDTVARLLQELGAVESDVVATATAIVASTSNGFESRTRVRRVRGGSLNLSIVDAVNALSRQAADGRMTPAQVRAELTRIEQSAPLYGFRSKLVAALLASAGFSLLFGGGMRELLVTLPSAMVLGALQQRLARTRLPALAAIILAALAGVVVAALVTRLLPVEQANVVFLSTVVLLVPGAAIVNAIGDLMGGHLLSGLARGAAAALVTAAIAAGVVVGLRLTGTRL